MNQEPKDFGPSKSGDKYTAVIVAAWNEPCEEATHALESTGRITVAQTGSDIVWNDTVAANVDFLLLVRNHFTNEDIADFRSAAKAYNIRVVCVSKSDNPSKTLTESIRATLFHYPALAIPRMSRSGGKKAKSPESHVKAQKTSPLLAQKSSPLIALALDEIESAKHAKQALDPDSEYAAATGLALDHYVLWMEQDVRVVKTHLLR